MKKMKVFFGPAESGKSINAKACAFNKKTHWVTARTKFDLADTRYIFKNVESDCELIIVDDVPLELLRDVMSLFFLPTLTINPQAKKAFEIPRPDVIITVTATLSELPTDHSTVRRFEYIEHFLPAPVVLASPVIHGFAQPKVERFYYSFKVNKKKIKGKVEAETHREAWTKVVHAVDTLEKLGGIIVTDVTIPSQPHQSLDPRLLIP